jgi:hypothetical protein
VHTASIAPFSVGVFLIIVGVALDGSKGSLRDITRVFLIIVGVALYWMILAANYRMYVPQSESAIWLAVIVGFLWGIFLWFFPKSKKYLRWIRSKKYLQWAGRMKGLLWITFVPSALSTAISLVWFAWIFREGNIIGLHKAHMRDVLFFSFAITLSYAPLVVAGIKTVLGKQFADVES